MAKTSIQQHTQESSRAGNALQDPRHNHCALLRVVPISHNPALSRVLPSANRLRTDSTRMIRNNKWVLHLKTFF